MVYSDPGIEIDQHYDLVVLQDHLESGIQGVVESDLSRHEWSLMLVRRHSQWWQGNF